MITIMITIMITNPYPEFRLIRKLDPMSIKQIITQWDQRGVISKIHQVYGPETSEQLLPSLSLKSIAKILLQDCRTIVIVTGFLVNQRQETDGPPGAIFLGQCLNKLGKRIVYVSNPQCISMLDHSLDFHAELIDFPVVSEEKSIEIAERILTDFRPDCLISIECCGRNAAGQYLNMNKKDISEVTPKIDTLFLSVDSKARQSEKTNSSSVQLTIGIGDGGNEIGFGLLNHEQLSKDFSVIPADALILSTVSNWGAYGLIAMLSLLDKKDYLPKPEAEALLIHHLVQLGAVDGFSGKQEAKVDGFELEQSGRILEALHADCLIFLDDNIT